MWTSLVQNNSAGNLFIRAVKSSRNWIANSFDYVRPSSVIVSSGSSGRLLSNALASQSSATSEARRRNVEHARRKAPQQVDCMEERPQPKFQSTKYPIVLCHGLFGYDQMGFTNLPLLQLRYWGGVYDSLVDAGAKVHIARVPATGNIEERAHHLQKFIAENCAGQDVNLVSHSMGGLDSRYLISHLASKSFTVRSLTTISTPHRGSPVMDWIKDNIGMGKLGMENMKELTKGRAEVLLPFLSRLIRAVDAPAYSNLTSQYLTQTFNPSTPDDNNVQYYSYGAAVDNMHPLSVLYLPHMVVTEKEGINDGVVSVYSAKWGQYLGTVEADHLELNKKRADDSPKSSRRFNMFTNFPLVNFLRFRYLYELISLDNPRIQALSFPGMSSLKTTTGVGSENQKPEDAYRERLNAILNRMHGPQSLDEFIMGYDSEDSPVNNRIPFDSVKFYLGVMDKLAKEGL